MQKRAKKSSIPILVLAGGLGTRLMEETQVKPKPMVSVGGEPILIHILRSYYAHGFNDFVICAGYRSMEIKRYLSEYPLSQNHFSLDLRKGAKPTWGPYGNSNNLENWRVRVIDTGDNCMTGGRVHRALETISQDTSFEQFGLTYGDGVSNVDLSAELDFHLKHKKIGTLVGVRDNSRYGELELADNSTTVTSFQEKPPHSQTFVNGGFFFFHKSFRSYLSDNEDLILEKSPLTQLSKDGQLEMFKHPGFWHAMDTLKDKVYLESLIKQGKAPWIPEEKVNEESLRHRSKRASGF